MSRAAATQASSGSSDRVKPGPSAAMTSRPVAPSASTRCSTNSTVGADLLPGVAQHLAFHVEAARGKRQRLLDGGDDLGAAGIADMARHPSRPEGVFGRGERLGQALGDEAGDRAVEDHPQADVVHVPADDVQRVGPHVRHPCPDQRRGASPGPSTAAAAPSPNTQSISTTE